MYRQKERPRVILSGVGALHREAVAESKDPYQLISCWARGYSLVPGSWRCHTSEGARVYIKASCSAGLRLA